MSSTTTDMTPDMTLIAAENQFRDLLAGYDRVTDWVSVESAALLQRLDDVKRLMINMPPQTLAGAAAKLRFLLEMIRRDWDDYLSEVVGEKSNRFDAPMLGQIIALLEREALKP